MPRPIHFDISVDDPERAARFYSEAFGWEVVKWDGPFDYWLIRTGAPAEPGINGGLARRENPSEAIMNFIGVPSVAECAAKIVALGGKLVRDRQAIPGVGFIAVCQDTEDNRFGILEADENAR
jgi:predicted enzyme related to lactoylglutathione lyase